MPTNQNQDDAVEATVVTEASSIDEGSAPVARNTVFVTPLVQSLRPNRRRSSRACLGCRARKVRCDVTQRHPCGNCRWGRHECVIYSRRAERAKPVQKVRYDTLMTPTQINLPVTSAPLSPPKQDFHILQRLDNPSLPPERQARAGLLSPAGISIDLESLELQIHLRPERGLFEDHLPESLSLPSFIKPPTSKLTAEDLAFLQSKGATTVPSVRVQNALIRAYVEHVHPLLPLINLEDFMESISEGNETNSQVSLLFFQAVLFAGSAYIDLDLLRDMGFWTRKLARKTFYDRVRLLYDFNWETDELVIIQALLLMTFWYDVSEDHKNAWHWMDVAISHAFANGLHLDPKLSRPTPSLTVQRRRRRIWWSSFLRDRLISLSMRRRPRIKDEDFNVPMLELADFQSEHLHGKKPARTDSVCSYFGDRNRRVTLARLCVAQVKLCKCLKYSVTSNGSLESIPTANSLLPIDGQSFATCQRDLLEWYDTLYHCDKYQPIEAKHIHSDGSANLELNRSVLHMLYHTGVLGLHHSRFSNPEIPSNEKEMSKVFVQHSAKQISQITRNIEEHGLHRFLPSTAMNITISAITVHLLELRGVFHADILDAQQNYQRCLVVMDSMKEMFFASDFSRMAMDVSVPFADLDDITLNSYECDTEENRE